MVDIDTTMACDISFSVVFSTKTMEIMKINFVHHVGKYDPSTELPCDFCAGIGPLQLGVVLVVKMFIHEPDLPQDAPKKALRSSVLSLPCFIFAVV